MKEGRFLPSFLFTIIEIAFIRSAMDMNNPLHPRYDYNQRKVERAYWFNLRHGNKMVICVACSGSGIYDHNGSPKCGSCDGLGKHRERE